MTAFTLLLVLLLGPWSALEARQSDSYSPDSIESLLELGDLEAALRMLDARLERRPEDPEALLLRSTAHLMQGDTVAGRTDLERSLALDPEQRQAWLNLGALHLADTAYRAAIDAFVKAEELDPEAPDNSLNIGAALLLAGDREAASKRFRSYLAKNETRGEAHFLVAVNYAVAGRADLAVPLLRRAIHLDEHLRLRVRTDPSFSRLADTVELQQLLATDSYRLPLGALVATRSYDSPFEGRTSRVLDAVLSALQLSGSPIEPVVEVTPTWALVWSDMRIKIAAAEDGGTVVTVSSTDVEHSATWASRTNDLFRRIAVQLHSRRPR